MNTPEVHYVLSFQYRDPKISYMLKQVFEILPVILMIPAHIETGVFLCNPCKKDIGVRVLELMIVYVSSKKDIVGFAGSYGPHEFLHVPSVSAGMKIRYESEPDMSAHLIGTEGIESLLQSVTSCYQQEDDDRKKNRDYNDYTCFSHSLTS